MQGFDVESLIQIQCTIMYGSDSCLQRCRASNKLHGNFLLFCPGCRAPQPRRARPGGGEAAERGLRAAPSALRPLRLGHLRAQPSTLAFGLMRGGHSAVAGREQVRLDQDFPPGTSRPSRERQPGWHGPRVAPAGGGVWGCRGARTAQALLIN